MSANPRIAILGRKKNTANYERFLSENSFEPFTTTTPGKIACCDGLVLPGGGDITPAFFGEHNRGSRNIDTELDILQFQALDLCLIHRLPVLGICKGMQLINIAFGGSFTQDMKDSHSHFSSDGDLYHPTVIEPDSPLYPLYGAEAIVNSAHHQCIKRVGRNLRVIQYSAPDGCPEALIHETLPILGLQWHPERLGTEHAKLSGAPVLSLFAAWISAFR